MRIVSCTRAEAQRQLVEMADGWQHSVCAHREERWAEVADAIIALWDFQAEVTAGHTTFRIQEEAA